MRRVTGATFVGMVLLANSAFGTDSSVPFINADQVHAQGITGAGITVAVIDTGIDFDDPGLADSIASGGISWQGGNPYYDGGADIYARGHGTYMALIITDATGVAPSAAILPIRVYGWRTVYTRDVVLGIRYAIARRLADPSIRVINLSLGSGYYSCPCDPATRAYAEAISSAANAGIITFAEGGVRPTAES